MLTLKIVKPDDAMDWMTFVSSLVGSIAWPIAAFAIAFLFRAQIRKLVDRLKKLSLGDNSLDFGERLDEAEAEATTALPAAAPEPAGIGLPDARTAQLIALSPAAAVVDAWRSIETEVKKRALPLLPQYATAAVSNHGQLAFRAAAKMLFQAGQITASTYSLLSDLNGLRNAAAHGDDITAADAVRFTMLAKQAHFFLEGPDVVPDNPDA
ncbi:hypothetical protein [Sphingomonas sp. Leaf28]|uniref:hypothetical protein n=1 Tax=Sphingomonas sp. Leaf28 TaxID=1735695 RepID=UPI0012E1DE24|nr:hypothetical protein [Sphingomonas sp. Leaf28]